MLQMLIAALTNISVLIFWNVFFPLYHRDSIEPLFESQNFSFTTHSVFLDSSNTPLPLAFDTFPLGGNVLHVRGMTNIIYFSLIRLWWKKKLSSDKWVLDFKQILIIRVVSKTKHSKTKTPKSRKRSTQNSKTKTLNLENEAPKNSKPVCPL